jgi:tRNA dimethylallyltransferase
MSAGAPPNTIVTLMGPTAAGKTELALALAELIDVDIISVDSAMIYRGMDIGTAKPSREVLARHRHRLIDIRDPTETYSAADFVADASDAVEAALAAGRLPLLVGGTMLYFKAFKHGLAAMPRTSPALRMELTERAHRDGLDALHAELVRVDPQAAAGIHPHNRQRLLRALEVYRSTGRPISEFWALQQDGGVAARLGCRLCEFAIAAPRERSSATIAARFDAMLAAGFLEEVRRLMQRGDLSADLPSMRCVGYRQVWEHLVGATDAETMRARAVTATRQLAKRQRTWLNSWRDLHVIDIVERADPAAILHSIRGAPIVPRTLE